MCVIGVCSHTLQHTRKPRHGLAQTHINTHSAPNRRCICTAVPASISSFHFLCVLSLCLRCVIALHTKTTHQKEDQITNQTTGPSMHGTLPGYCPPSFAFPFLRPFFWHSFRQRLSTARLIAPCYIVVCGCRAGEGVVLTRNRLSQVWVPSRESRGGGGQDSPAWPFFCSLQEH